MPPAGSGPAGAALPAGSVGAAAGSAVATATSVVTAATTPDRTPLTGGAQDGKPTMI